MLRGVRGYLICTTVIFLNKRTKLRRVKIQIIIFRAFPVSGWKNNTGNVDSNLFFLKGRTGAVIFPSWNHGPDAVLYWSWTALIPESHLCSYTPNPLFCSITLAAWNQPRWESIHTTDTGKHSNQPSYQSSGLKTDQHAHPVTSGTHLPPLTPPSHRDLISRVILPAWWIKPLNFLPDFSHSPCSLCSCSSHIVFIMNELDKGTGTG